MSDATIVLCGAAASIGFIHTLLGPDHYLPFVAMSRAGAWSLRKTLWVTLACGIGHVLGSLVLGIVGISLGIAVFELESVERFRGALAGWMLTAMGLAYFSWGVRRAVRNRPHVHVHAHEDGTIHRHEHVHQSDHVHVHAVGGLDGSHEEAGARRGSAGTMTPWLLFTVFVFGPCELLIPLLMYPAAAGAFGDVAIVTAVFAVVTVATMLAAVVTLRFFVEVTPFGQYSRYSHAAAGFVVLLCGVAVTVGW